MRVSVGRLDDDADALCRLPRVCESEVDLGLGSLLGGAPPVATTQQYSGTRSDHEDATRPTYICFVYYKMCIYDLPRLYMPPIDHRHPAPLKESALLPVIKAIT